MSEEKQKRGPKPQADKMVEMQAQIDLLTRVVSMMGHYNGCNRVLDECGLGRWNPEKKHMGKNRG